MKHVIAATKEDGAVRIVHPVVSREEMILRAERISGELVAESIRGGVLGKKRQLSRCRRNSGRGGELQEISSSKLHIPPAIRAACRLAWAM